MNRDDLLDSALQLIAKGDDSHPAMAMACYIGAIAKLLLAQAAGPVASPPDHGGTSLDPDLLAWRLTQFVRDASASPGPPPFPRITDESEWLPGDPT